MLLPTKTPQPAVKAQKIAKYEMAGVGALLQLFGVLLLIGSFGFGTIGAVIGFLCALCLFYVGSARAQVFKCSRCAEKVQKAARVCPHCGVEFPE